jgi:hypothetical protein
MAYTFVYANRVSEVRYEYDDESYAALAANGVRWQDADYVLRHAKTVIGERIGPAILRIIGRDHRPAWLMVMTVEIVWATGARRLTDTTDDIYRVTGARYLNATEAAIAAKITGLE